MNKLVFVFVILFIALISCDGRDRVHKDKVEILKENKLLDTFSNNIKYFPIEYSEVETDTILSNGFRVKIKVFTDMENSYLDEFKSDTITHKHYYRDFKSQITVLYEALVFDAQIDKEFILQIDPTYALFFEESILQNVWLDEEQSLANTNTTINIEYCKPETDGCVFYKLIIDKNGQYSMQDVSRDMYDGYN